MRIINKFLEEEDFKLVSFRCLRKEFEHIYSNILNKGPEIYGSKFPDQTKICWARDWEYPWAIINSDVKAGEKVLDCGCGGSPLLPFLAQFGCEAYGIDPNIFKKKSLLRYYYDMIKKIMHKFRDKNSQGLTGNFKQGFFKIAISYLRRQDNLDRLDKDPNKLGFKIKFFEESLDKIHFEDNFFDKIFCISVIEHLSKETAYSGMKEMARVLKKDGLLVMTIDNDGPHVTPELVGKYEELISASGLEIYGVSNFKMPAPDNVPGTFNVVGFMLKK